MNNQGAFDIALLHLLNQAHRCASSTGRSQFRSLRGGKSAIGALIPDHLYSSAMEGKTVQQLLVASGQGYDAVREHLSGVAPQLLNELQDLHDRAGNSLPSLFRDIVLAGGYQIARMFRLSVRMLQLWGAYRKLSGPRVEWRAEPVPTPTEQVQTRAEQLVPTPTEPVVLERVSDVATPRHSEEPNVSAVPERQAPRHNPYEAIEQRLQELLRGIA